VKGESPFFHVKSYDQAVDVAKAKELGVTANGFVVFSRGGHKELRSLGTELASARSQLRTLDQETQKRLLQVARTKRVLYFVGGHGERSEDNTRAEDKRPTLRELRTQLRAQNYELSNLSAASGLASVVPSNAAALFIIGPTTRLLPEEVTAITTYVRGGGRLFLALEPDAGLDQADLLQPFGVKFVPTVLASDKVYAAVNRQGSDKANILTGSYSSHPSVTSLSHYGNRAPMLLLGAGHLEEAGKDRPKELSIDYTVHADSSTWVDLNGNFEFDAPAETRKAYELAAAITYRKSREVKPEEEGRVFVLADSDALGDQAIQFYGNQALPYDPVKWLVGDESIAGSINSEADVPIAHTRKEDVFWFYSTIFLAPALVVGAGLIITRRRGGRR
jgi:hypothetical protein